jgi:phosphatidylethanolamine N-methyltransferase
MTHSAVATHGEGERQLSAQSSDDSLFSVANNDSDNISEKPTGDHKRPTGRTSDDVFFEVPETHDMVRSLFDPTLRKSYAEVLIFISLVANVGVYRWLSSQQARIYGFCALYAFWRLAYNLGIGLILYRQSNHNTLVNFAKRQGLFKHDNNTLLQKLTHLEMKSKMGRSYDVEKYPIEFNTWIIFRQFVDLILMQDFTSYMFLVYTSGQNSVLSQAPFLNYTRIILGSLMVLFNLWVKIDAHRVVKDYAWYWGDFFFLQESELIFDGVFNLSPHPMYSIGYIGYYGFALITKSYLILIVSLIAHTLQFLFLNYVEEPHIIKIYGSEANEHVVEELEDNEHYLRPLIVFKNFNPIRITDYMTLSIAFFSILIPFSIDFGNHRWTDILFGCALLIKVIQAFSVSFILQKQSTEKWWTRIYLKYGLDNFSAYTNWQVLYNALLVLSYTSFFGVASREVLNGQFKSGNWLLLRVILGGLLILLQVWTSSSIYTSIGDFGWFYGDFFLPNLSSKTLTKSGIYRYLNDPERLLGVAGIWGAVLITYSPYVFVLAMVWTIHMSLHLAFVEKPHMIKVYGEQQVLKNVSGVSLTLKQLLPSKLNNTIGNIYTNTFSRVDTYIKKRTQSEVIHSKDLRPVLRRESISHSSGYCLSIVGCNSDSTVEIGNPISVKWKAPASHDPKDWIGLYQVMRTGSSRKVTNISSSGKWIAVNPDAYQRSHGIVKRESKDGSNVVSGLVEFKGDLLIFEKGIYELRYHRSGSHKVLCISAPFEVVIPSIAVDEDLSAKLLGIVQRVYSVEAIDSILDFKKIDPKSLSDLVSSATAIDIADQVIVKLKTLENISARVTKSKNILDNLNNE